MPTPSRIDLNSPVENVALVQAIAGVAADPSDSTKDHLLVELNRANFLAAMLADELKKTEVEPGRVQIEAGSKFGILSASSGGKNFLLLFTDWPALRAYTDLQVSGWVLPARDAWSFALEGATYDGVVINPAHNALPLERPMLKFLASRSDA